MLPICKCLVSNVDFIFSLSYHHGLRERSVGVNNLAERADSLDLATRRGIGDFHAPFHKYHGGGAQVTGRDRNDGNGRACSTGC